MFAINPVEVSTTAPTTIATSTPPSFLTHLFDPADEIDPSFSSSPSSHPSWPSTTTPSTLDLDSSSFFRPPLPPPMSPSPGVDRVPDCGGECPQDHNINNGGGAGDEGPYQDEVYFVLVVTVCGLTALAAVAVSIYRIVEALIKYRIRERHRERRANQAQRGHGNARSPPSSLPNSNRVVEIVADEEAGATGGRTAMPAPPPPTEFLSHLLSFRASSSSHSGAAQSSSSSRLTSILFPKPDAPPPYDSPPPYHVAIDMDSSNRVVQQPSLESTPANTMDRRRRADELWDAEAMAEVAAATLGSTSSSSDSVGLDTPDRGRRRRVSGGGDKRTGRIWKLVWFL